jgi:hypothetical protein
MIGLLGDRFHLVAETILQGVSAGRASDKVHLAHLIFPLSGSTETGYRAVMIMTIAWRAVGLASSYSASSVQKQMSGANKTARLIR